MEESPSAALASLPSQFRYEALPAPVVEKTKRLILDGLGCGLAGASSPLSQTVRRFAREFSPGAYTVIGADAGATLLEAVFANAASINAQDFDDTGFRGHPGAIVLPAVLAMAEHVEANGQDVIGATALGYQACTRLSRALQPTHEQEQRVFGNGTCHVFGAALAAAYLLRLDAQTLADAIGIAGAFAPMANTGKYGWEVNRVSWVKDNLPRAAEAGVRAALLAQRGFVGHRHFLDGDSGFWRMAGSDRFQAEHVLDASAGFDICAVSIKPYPCCRWMHTALDAAVQLRIAVGSAKIAAVEVHTIEPCAQHLANPAPQTLVDAQFSLPHCVALVLLDVAVDQWQTQEALHAPAVRALARRVSVHTDDAAQREYLARGRPDFGACARVAVTTHDDQRLEAQVHMPHVLGADAVDAKFLRNAEPVIGSACARRMTELVGELERMQDLAELTSLLRAPTGNAGTTSAPAKGSRSH
jgi:2-methylcitrate dehydratase PrpD